MRTATAVALLGLALATHAAPARMWHIQSPPSHADFGIRLLWLHTVHGRFERIVGTVRPQVDEQVVVDARVAVDSLAMDSQRLRRWVLDEEFFDAAHYPALHFVSAPVARGALEEGGPLDGQLTLRGVTRPVRFELLPARCTADACLIEAHGELRRSEFGMGGHHALLSDHVELALSIAIARAPD
ncbi:YceI family protein [Frateuria terrea]|uniref:Polyisoprenoid-binding protein YceI n=1 Tax=Frateuria terrea TaxID=529704 RepID=A0A1H6T0D8_9GAMM|nr:YceI family protein [Frateuria terrea]SEI73589.1 Polyisoprenoid-binding protein YceI [Frateuria terrea]SFP29849.1 Polyisoprenoid-binding protein YceI [Frateuria terrea]